MELYVNSVGIMCHGGSNADENFLSSAPEYNSEILNCKEPDYTGIIPPMQLRRMSKAVRVGIAASKICMRNAGVEKPDAISVGTAMGCLHDTEQFLSKMIDQKEQMLTPTAFIQSTHNTVAGAIAMLTSCNGHNLTFVHKGHSFEHALVNAEMYLQSHPGHKLITGGIDELIDTSRAVMQEMGVYTAKNMSAADVLAQNSNGSIAGEGAAFFLMSREHTPGSLCIRSLHLFTTCDDDEAIHQVNVFLSNAGINTADIDLVMTGIGGDAKHKNFYNRLGTEVFPDNCRAAYKHVSGDFATSSAVALGILLHATQKQSLPEFMLLNGTPKQLKNIVFINQFADHYSCWHLQA